MIKKNQIKPEPTRHLNAVLTIDLNAIVDNWIFLNKLVSPLSRCAAVVKANAYGLGVTYVASALYTAGCRCFIVANLDEALELRSILSKATIFVLTGPFSRNEKEFCVANIIPVLNSLEQIANWRSTARLFERPLPSVIHVDTGMSYLGLRANEIKFLSEDNETITAIKPILLMSHLACADDPTHHLNKKQLETFRAIRSLFPNVLGSLAASSGIFLGSEWHADLCRPGAALYGIQKHNTNSKPMNPVVQLDGKIIQIHDIDVGESVGYGATYTAKNPGKLAIVAVGYADGLFRSMENRGYGYFKEYKVPLVGRVSMDLTAFDITDLPHGIAKPGTTINLIGPNNSVNDLGQTAGTIGYEILTSLGYRYNRRYINESL
ncbi:MAG: alanine racemase [Rhodospirillaceae bacterium]|jgi:alanine racemase|nr:alanine racemase [Rhodospirillaceae bacterium]